MEEKRELQELSGEEVCSMKRWRAILAVVLFLLAFTFLTAQNVLKRVILDELLAIGEFDGRRIYQKVDVTSDPEGGVYITDLKGTAIKKFNRIGYLIAEIGKNGEEPGDFNSPNLIKYHNDKIYVTESYRPGIRVFDKNLTFKLKIPLRFTVIDLNLISDSQFAVSALVRDRSEEGIFNYCIYIYDIEGSEKEKIIYATSKSFTMMNMVYFKIDRSGNFLIAYCWQDKIEKLSRNGNSLWTRSLLDNRVARTRNIKGTKVDISEYPTETVYKAIALDSFGNLFILGGDLAENKNQDVYVLSGSGLPLTTFTLPEAAHTIHIDSKNNLYVRSEDGLRVRKYALEYIYE